MPLKLHPTDPDKVVFATKPSLWDYTQYETQRRVFLEYLQVMIAMEDWHGVADLAMDMRELEARHKAEEKK